MVARQIRYSSLFLSAFVAGVVAVLLIAGLSRVESRRSEAPTRTPVEIQQLAPGVWVAGQIDTADVPMFRNRGFKAVIGLRPDGEVPGQPSASDIGAMTNGQSMRFAYVPVPHGDMPDAVADDLATALAGGEGPVLLYCRSGRRAARAWALAEASRPGGLLVEEIEARVAGVGQSVDDLGDRLRRRAALRPSVEVVSK